MVTGRLCQYTHSAPGHQAIGLQVVLEIRGKGFKPDNGDLLTWGSVPQSGASGGVDPAHGGGDHDADETGE